MRIQDVVEPTELTSSKILRTWTSGWASALRAHSVLARGRLSGSDRYVPTGRKCSWLVFNVWEPLVYRTNYVRLHHLLDVWSGRSFREETIRSAPPCRACCDKLRREKVDKYLLCNLLEDGGHHAG